VGVAQVLYPLGHQLEQASHVKKLKASIRGNTHVKLEGITPIKQEVKVSKMLTSYLN
jgi:hypothetical protein